MPALDEQIRLLVEPLLPQIEQLDSIPGVNAIARDILGEIGTDMSRFGSAARLASWAKISPGNNASVANGASGAHGQRGIATATRPSSNVHGAARKTPTFLGRTFRRLAARLGGKRAAVAVGHKILVIVDHLLWQGLIMRAAYTDQRPKQEERDCKRAITALERLVIR